MKNKNNVHRIRRYPLFCLLFKELTIHIGEHTENSHWLKNITSSKNCDVSVDMYLLNGKSTLSPLQR